MTSLAILLLLYDRKYPILHMWPTEIKVLLFRLKRMCGKVSVQPYISTYYEATKNLVEGQKFKFEDEHASLQPPVDQVICNFQILLEFYLFCFKPEAKSIFLHPSNWRTNIFVAVFAHMQQRSRLCLRL